jgi:hypothetical protein
MSKVQLTPEEAMKVKRGTRWGCHTPAILSPGKGNGTFAQEAGRAQCLYGWVQKISPPPGFDPRTIQPVASHRDNGINFRSIKVEEFILDTRHPAAYMKNCFYQSNSPK